jgi:hypothetical protein
MSSDYVETFAGTSSINSFQGRGLDVHVRGNEQSK